MSVLSKQKLYITVYLDEKLYMRKDLILRGFIPNFEF